MRSTNEEAPSNSQDKSWRSCLAHYRDCFLTDRQRERFDAAWKKRYGDEQTMAKSNECQIRPMLETLACIMYDLDLAGESLPQE